jgi:dihydropteroate synthase
VPVVLMHMQGDPRSMQLQPYYDDVVENILSFFHERIRHCLARGVGRLIIDPGIGFGKTLAHNLALLHALPRFTELGYPVLVGTSRKSFLGSITGLPVDQRLPATIASNILACQRGARLLRVHDVRAVRAALDVVTAIERGVEDAHAV